MIEVKIYERKAEVIFHLYDYDFGDFPVASAVMSYWDFASVYGVGTAPEYRNRGYCKAVMQALVVYADNKGHLGLGLTVRAGNFPALRAYESVGFEIVESYETYHKMERVRS
jgi:ribosomal protein S18 acetylase RimI-like enzyme